MKDLRGPALQKLIDKCPKGKPLSDHLSEEFARINGIQIMLSSYRLRREAIMKKAHEESADLQKQIERKQQECQHEQTQDHRSGVDSADDYTDCTICGKILK